MAVIQMKKLKIIGLKEDYDNIMDILTKSHCFHISSSLKPSDNMATLDDSEQKTAKLLAKQSRVGFAIDYILKQDDTFLANKKRLDKLNKSKNKRLKENTNQQSDDNADATATQDNQEQDNKAIDSEQKNQSYTPIKKESLRPDINADYVLTMQQNEQRLMEIVSKIDQISFDQSEINSKIQKCNDKIAGFMPYISFSGRFSDVFNTKKTFSILCAFPISFNILAAFDNVFIRIHEGNKLNGDKFSTACLTGLNEYYDETVKKLNEHGMTICPFKGDTSPLQLIEKEQEEIARLKEESCQLFKSTLSLAEHLADLKILYDYYNIKLERYPSEGVLNTSATIIFEGYCPSEAAEVVANKLKEDISGVFVKTEDILKEESAPTLTKNNKAVTAFEDLTALYTTPDYRDKDPNAVMAFWYFLIFGIMLADAVYGILISAVCFTLLKVKRFEKGMTNMIRLFGICGLSAILWGVIFGSFFGFSIPVPSSFPFKFLSDERYYFGWFSPMSKPIMLLGVSIVVGMMHIICGYVLKIVALIKEKDYVGAICDVGFMITVILAIALLGANIFAGIFTTGELDLKSKVLPEGLSNVLSKTGMIVLIISIAGIFITAGRSSLKKGKIGAWLGSGLNNTYGLVNIVSDILSYSRIFGLGIAGGAIGFAFNTLVQSLFWQSGNVVAYVLGAVVLVLLHLFNLAIGVLGAYVHNARLQFLEFYGKFLIGDGKPFIPLGEKTKYIKLK